MKRVLLLTVVAAFCAAPARAGRDLQPRPGRGPRSRRGDGGSDAEAAQGDAIRRSAPDAGQGAVRPGLPPDRGLGRVQGPVSFLTGAHLFAAPRGMAYDGLFE